MKQKNVLEYLEETAPRLPDKVAYADDNCELTFSQVYNASRSIGSALSNKGYYNEPIVVFMAKKPQTIATFFGCVYGGNYYIPIDPEMPRFRIELIFQNLNPKAVICDEESLPLREQRGGVRRGGCGY